MTQVPDNDNRYDITATSDPDTWRALVSDVSRAVASLRANNQIIDPTQESTPLHLIYNHVLGRPIQMALPPETYVIRYYVAEPGGPIPAHAFSVYSGQQYVQRSEDIQGIDAGMHRAVVESFETIEAQLPGRFRFERVSDPQRATLSFVSIPDVSDHANVVEGSAHKGTGIIAFNREVFATSDPSGRRLTALHEILHGMGLEHPHDVMEGKPTHDRASYRDTVMTYTTVNARSPRALQDDPVGLMPADIAALLVLYPIAEDRRLGGARVDQIPSHHALADGPRLRSPHAERTVAVPRDGGAAYMAAADTTDADTYLPAASGIGHRIRQEAEGVTVGVTRLGTAHIPVHLETIEFGPDDVVQTAGNVTVRPHDPAAALRSQLSMSGTGNVVQLDAATLSRAGDFQLSLRPGSQTRLEISNGEAFDGSTDLASFVQLAVNGMLRPGVTQVVWDRPDPNRFTITGHYGHTGESMALDIQFDHLAPMAAARFQAALERDGITVAGFHGQENVAMQREATAPVTAAGEGHGLRTTPGARPSQEPQR